MNKNTTIGGMTIHKLSNPHNFVKECRAKGVCYEYLLEAMTCIGQQKVCEMFVGKSCRGGTNNISAGTLQNWMATFEYARSNPDVKDDDPFQSRIIEKKASLYDDYVKLVNTEIDEETMKSWDGLSINKLGNEAVKYGITLGVRNSKSIQNLRERMKDMWDRRKRKFWSGVMETDQVDENHEDDTNDYRMKNIITLKQIAKERGIVFLHKSKDEIIQLLEAFDSKKDMENEDPMDYDKMNSRQLKDLAKIRGFNQYNNMNNTNLRLIHKEYDTAIQKKKEEQKTSITDEKEEDDQEVKEFQLVHENGDNFPILIREDGMVNATMLCKAGGKKFAHYQRNEQTHAFIEALKSDVQYRNTQLIIVKQGNTSQFTQGTWCHRLIAIDCARWLSPRFALQVIKWTDEILTKGCVKIEKPLLPILDRTHLDLEAEELERECNPLSYSNQFVLYIAYIGDQGLIKVGSSDCRIHERELKHMSCESIYPQFRFIKIFPISSGCIETLIHNLLDKYRYSYQKQKEIYKPSGKLQEFIDMIGKLLEEHDLQLQLSRYKIENLELKNILLEKDKEIMELKNRNKESEI